MSNRKVFILTNSSMFDIIEIVKYMQSKGFIVTNSDDNYKELDIVQADCILPLRGWNNTKKTGNLMEFAVKEKKTILSRINYNYITRE